MVRDIQTEKNYIGKPHSNLIFPVWSVLFLCASHFWKRAGMKEGSWEGFRIIVIVTILLYRLNRSRRYFTSRSFGLLLPFSVAWLPLAPAQVAVSGERRQRGAVLVDLGRARGRGETRSPVTTFLWGFGHRRRSGILRALVCLFEVISIPFT